MLFIAFIALLLTSVFAAPASPSKKSTCRTGNLINPWVLTDITLWEPRNSSISKMGTITFHFSDANEDLHLETECVGTTANGDCEGEDGAYITCQEGDVEFKLIGGEIQMARKYIDDCLGEAPYNHGIAFGNNKTQLVPTPGSTGGRMSTQTQMLVPITSLA